MINISVEALSKDYPSGMDIDLLCIGSWCVPEAANLVGILNSRGAALLRM
jgi:hypothetical protein